MQSIILKTKLETIKNNKQKNEKLEKSSHEKDWLIAQLKTEKNKTKPLKKQKGIVRKKEIEKTSEL